MLTFDFVLAQSTRETATSRQKLKGTSPGGGEDSANSSYGLSKYKCLLSYNSTLMVESQTNS